MKKDILFPKVEDMAVAIVKEENEHQEMVWNAYLLNLKSDEITGVLVSTKGYGTKNEEKVQTSELRHFIDTMPAQSFAKIELITPELTGISNQFWVSFYHNKVMYDKKYVFVAESISESNFVQVPLLQKEGVMIQ